MELDEKLRKQSTDQFVLLYLLYYAKKKNITDTSKLKITKLLAYLKSELNKTGVQAYHTDFYRWKQGLFTKELYPQINALVDSGVASLATLSQDSPIQINQEGEEVIRFFEKKLPEDNLSVLKEHILNILDTFGYMTAAQLRRRNHEAGVLTNSGIKKIDDLPENENQIVLGNLRKPKVELKFDDKLTSEWLVMRSVESSSKDTKNIEELDEKSLPKNIKELLKLASSR